MVATEPPAGTWRTADGAAIELNAPPGSGEFLGGIETSFPDYGGPQMLRWYAARTLDRLPAPDQLGARTPDGRLIAGLVVNYRRLGGPPGLDARAGVLCNAWTLPAARGRGLFSRLVSAAQELCRARGCHLLTAFVVETNTSFRAFRAMGAAGAPTAYCVLDTPPSHDVELAAEPVDEATAAGLLAWRPPPRSGALQFLYSDEDWLGQFVRKPQPVGRLVHPSGASAIVETHPSTLRINAADYADPAQLRLLLAALGGHAQRSGRALFGYATQPAAIAAYAAAGFRVMPGRLILIEVDLAAVGATLAQLFEPAPGWDLQSGDRV